MPEFTEPESTYTPLYDSGPLPPEDLDQLSMAVSDKDLATMITTSLQQDIDYWNTNPWNLKETDESNVAFFLGDQIKRAPYVEETSPYIDNRLFTATRAILSYATGSLAIPELIPSASDDQFQKAARNMQAAMYKHAQDNQVDQKTRAAVTNLLVRKRGYLKLRFDPNRGMDGDIVTEVVNPEDIIIDRFAGFLSNPNKIYQRIRCSIDELVTRFPSKKTEIYKAFSIQKGVYTQRSKYVTYYEVWFTYYEGNEAKEGVCWFLPQNSLILDKDPNPNWIYTGDTKQDKRINLLDCPPKPYVNFNYINLGHSFIDETCLFDQAKSQQEMLNRRGKQFNENVDFMNGRWVASKHAMNEEDGIKFVNKGAKTIALVDTDDVTKAINVLTPNAVSTQVYESMLDFRAEIDGIMGTPAQFKGEKSMSSSSDTLGRDIMIKQQAGMLQDDLVRAVSFGMEKYYQILLQMMKVYYTEDHWFSTKSPDGGYQYILLNGDTIDSNVKVSVQVDSTLPLDKAQIRATSMELWKTGQAIDYLTLMEDLGLPEPEVRAERYMRSTIDPMGYLASIKASEDDTDASTDLDLVMMGKEPQERDNYSKEYLDTANRFLMSNRFQKMIAEDPESAQGVTAFIALVQDKANRTAVLQETQVDDADMLPMMPQAPPPAEEEPPAPSPTTTP